VGRTIYDPSQISEDLIRARSQRWPLIDLFFLEDFFCTAGANPHSSVGTITAINFRGGAFNALSGAVAGNQAILDVNPAAALKFTGNRDFLFRARIRSNTTTDQYLYIGLYSVRPTAAAPPVEPANAIYFRRIDVAAVANWFAATRAGGVETAVDTTILGDALWHVYTIKRVGDVVEFQIDGVTRARITTNLLAVDVGLGVVLVTQAAAAKNFDIDYFEMIQER